MILLMRFQLGFGSLRNRRLLVWLFCALLAVHCATASAQYRGGRPTKLQLIALNGSGRKGRPVFFTVSLLDDNNRPASAPSDTTVRIDFVAAAGRSVGSQNVTIQHGSGIVRFAYRLRDGGIYRVRASGAGLRGNEVIFRVDSAATNPGGDGARLAVRAGRAALAPIASLRVRGGGFSRLGGARGYVLLASRHGQRRTARATGGAAETAKLHILLFGQEVPDWYRADGADAATITAMLDGNENAPADLKILLEANGGNLSANELVISRGQNQGTVKLTSETAGKIHVQNLGANGNVALECPKELNFEFIPAITKVKLSPEPLKQSLSDPATPFLVKLVNNRDLETATSQACEVLLIADPPDCVSIRPNPVPIKQGSASGEAFLEPRRSGHFKITVSPSSLATPLADRVEDGNYIDPPNTGLDIVVLLGGIVGGAVAFATTKDRKNPALLASRLLIGLVIGPLLYWACVFAKPDLVTRTFSQGSLGNQFSAFFIPVVGGYGGTAILTMLLGLFGVRDSPQQPAPRARGGRSAGHDPRV